MQIIPAPEEEELHLVHFDAESAAATIEKARLPIANRLHIQFAEIGQIILEGDWRKTQAALRACGGPSYQRVALFADVTVNTDGWIASKDSLHFISNGGCSMEALENPFHGLPSASQTLPQVITIAEFWGQGPWHFGGECFMGLAFVTRKMIEESYIHVTSRSDLVLDWLKLVGVEPSRVVTGTIATKRLIVPEISHCMYPSAEHLDWAHTGIQRSLGAPSRRKTIVLIERNTRTMGNAAELAKRLQQFADDEGYTIVMHSDRNLGTLREQLLRFAEASIIVGPHGAGETFLIATQPGACVVEIFSYSHVNILYSRLALMLGLDYFSTMMHSQGQQEIVDVDIVLENISQCRIARECW